MKIKHIHFVGIGGIGVSALARIMKQKGAEASGSDLNQSEITDSLEKLGINIFLGKHSATNIPNKAEVVVYTAASPQENPELLVAKKRGLKVFSYPEFVAELTKNYKLVAVSGTHGKTTTTALSSLVLAEAGLDPTVIVGSNLEQLDGNARLGKGDLFVLEADEYRSAFHNYHPYIAIVTSLDFDHPDCFKDLQAVKDSFKKFLENVSPDGLIIANADDKKVSEVVSQIDRKVIWYGLKKGDVRAKNIQVSKQLNFDVQSGFGEIKNVILNVFGRHNIQNSLAAISLAQFLDVPAPKIKAGLEKYHGAWRRFEIKAEKKGITVIDDYAHHPAEIRASLEYAQQKYPDRRLVIIYQPHHQDRTEALFDEFAPALSKAGLVFLTDVYRVPGRTTSLELPMEKIVDDIKKNDTEAYFVENFKEAPKEAVEHIQKGDVVMVMGAGDINLITSELIEKI